MSSDVSPKARLLSIISTLKAPKGGEWNAAHSEAYAMGLIDMPDADCVVMAKAILRRFEWRPSVSEILNLHAELTSDDDETTIADMLIKLRVLVGNYGDHGARHPTFPMSWPVIRALGAPPEFALLPKAAQKTVLAFGGWEEFARNFSWSSAADRAQFRDIFKAASVSASDADLKRLRLAYRAERRPELDAPADLEQPELVAARQAIGRDEATEIMGRLRQIARPL